MGAAHAGSTSNLFVCVLYFKIMFINGYKFLWFCFSMHLKGANFSDLVKKRIINSTTTI